MWQRSKEEQLQQLTFLMLFYPPSIMTDGSTIESKQIWIVKALFGCQFV
jgi:hypothetical protein